MRDYVCQCWIKWISEQEVLLETKWHQIWVHQTTEPQTHKVKADGAKRSGPTGSDNWGFNTASLNRWPQRRRWRPIPGLSPGKACGWRSLVGCSPWGRDESDAAKRLHFHSSLSCTGKGDGNPLQCSWPEESQGRGSPVGCRLWGRTESDTTEAT